MGPDPDDRWPCRAERPMRTAVVRVRLPVLVLAVVIATNACARAPTVTRDQLAAAIERDAIPFEGDELPRAVVDRLAEHRVVLIGETHHLREHWELTTELLRQLHGRGFRQFLVERPHMDGWLLDDQYANGAALVPTWSPPPYFERRFAGLRDLNATLPPDQRIHLASIDANLDDYGGAADFRTLVDMVADTLPDAGPLTAFLAGAYDTADAQTSAVEGLLASLADQRPALVESWGADTFDLVTEMAEIERVSIDVRARAGDDASRAREDVIKRLLDLRLADYPHRTLINVGGHHAQKSPLMGTRQEWMGDYLAHRSTAVDGDVFVLGVTSARTVLEPGAGGTPFDVTETSPDDELYRVIAEAHPGTTVFLPLDDPLFSDETVAMNSEDVIYLTSLRDQFDAVLQYGLAHRMPID